MSPGGGSSGGAVFMRRGEEWMGQRRVHDCFALGQLRNDQVVEQGVGGSRVGFPIYGGGNIGEDMASNMLVLVIINAFLGHNPLSGYRSVRDIVSRSVDVITALPHHAFGTV